MSVNDVHSIAPKVDRQQLLGDLIRLSAENRDYYGTVEKNDDRFQLRYYPSQAEGLIEEKRLSWNEGVRALEQIAPRICTYLSAKGIQLPAAETKGAGLMAWVLREWLVGNRGNASSVTTAFDAVRESILMLDGNVLELATELYSKLHRLVQLHHRIANGRFYISYDNDNQDIGAFQATYGLHFEQLNQTLAAVDGVRWHPELRMYLFDTIAYPKPSFSDGLPLAPTNADTFADEALERFNRLKGLYLRLWESINLNMPIAWKANEDRRIWHEFGIDDDFSRLRQGMTWEASMIRRLVNERGGLGVVQNDTADTATEQDNPEALLHKAVKEFARLHLKYESNEQKLVYEMLDGVLIIEVLKVMFFGYEVKASKQFSALWNTVSDKMNAAVQIAIVKNGVNELKFEPEPNRNPAGT
jgi:hypothetical protein